MNPVPSKIFCKALIIAMAWCSWGGIFFKTEYYGVTSKWLKKRYPTIEQTICAQMWLFPFWGNDKKIFTAVLVKL